MALKKKKKPVAVKKKAAPAKKKLAPKVKPKATAKPSVKPKAKVTAKSKPAFAKAKSAPTPSRRFDQLKPLDDRILVHPEPAATETASGLIIPGTASERPARGRVLAVGSGRRDQKGRVRPLDVNVGEAVVFAEGAGVKVTIGAEELLILREDEVLGVADHSGVSR